MGSIPQRKSIRKSVKEHSKFLNSIGSAQMEQELQYKVLAIIKRLSDKMAEDTGVESSLSEEEMKQYMNSVLDEINTNKKDGPKPKVSRSHYTASGKFCRRCECYFVTEKLFCECCGMRLRGSPAARIYKEKARAKKTDCCSMISGEKSSDTYLLKIKEG